MGAYQEYSRIQTPSCVPCPSPQDTQLNPIEYFTGWLSGLSSDELKLHYCDLPVAILDQNDCVVDGCVLLDRMIELARLCFPKASPEILKLAYTGRPSDGVASVSGFSEKASYHRKLFGIPVAYLLDAEMPLNHRKEQLLRAFYGMTTGGDTP